MLKLETGLLIPVTWVSIGSILELAGEVMDNSFIEQAVKLLVGALVISVSKRCRWNAGRRQSKTHIKCKML